jgi:NADPH:quinone reductase-like Zn-dependent oxidoreductase
LYGVRIKFIVYNESVLPGSRDALTDAPLPGAEPAGYDLLVEVHSVSVNPVDTKIGGGMLLPQWHQVLVRDASGVVCAACWTSKWRVARNGLTQAQGTVAGTSIRSLYKQSYIDLSRLVLPFLSRRNAWTCPRRKHDNEAVCLT